MPRKKKQDVKINDSSSLEGLLQETYNDACLQISEAQSVINELSTNVNLEANNQANINNEISIDDLTKIAKEKGGLLKVKDSGIRIKLEIAKLQSDILKNSGNAEAAITERTDGKASLDDMRSVREMIKKKNSGEEDDY
jgi:hypothetical protein